MPLLKPIRAIRLNGNHPLARGLVACWLFNEGVGGEIFDVSGNGNKGTLKAQTSWGAGQFGSCMHFDGTDDYIEFGTNDFGIGETNEVSVLVWARRQSGGDYYQALCQRGQYVKPFGLRLFGDSCILQWVVNISGSGANYLLGPSELLGLGEWGQFVGTYRSGDQRIYVNGISRNSTALTGSVSITSDNTTIGRVPNSSNYWFSGEIDHVLIFNRCLNAEEIAWLYREPFAMFDDGIRPESVFASVAIVSLAGFVSAQSAALATPKRLRKVSGSVTSTSGTVALLETICSAPKIETDWLRDALFNGMTANALKLGTTLSLGWFWVRVAGCSALYRGPGMEQIDFTNMLAVAAQNACVISPPGYLPHNDSHTYFYVVRRFNSCGYQEHTLGAAAKVSMDQSGELEKPQPNKVYSAKTEQVSCNQIRLVWFYCPIEQGSKPVRFNIYYDDRTGQIDYENPLATVTYQGRKFYSFQSGALELGRYLFAIRAEDADGVAGTSLAQLSVQLNAVNLDPIDILGARSL